MGRIRAYIRVSTEKQVEYSPDSQVRLIREYAAREGRKILDEDIYMELAVSGTKADKRPEFQKMIASAKRKEFDILYIYHSSRFARNNEESTIYRAMLKRDCGIDVISITQPSVNPKVDMMMDAINGVMDEWYIWDLRENVKRGMTQKAMEGHYQCSPPYGYKIPGRKQAPVIVEAEAEIIRLIFQKYLNGETSIFNIARDLNGLGLRTRRGGYWQRRTVEYIIRNPAYKGMAVWNKRNNNKEINDPKEWIIRQGTHEPIIEPELFDKVQDIYYGMKKIRHAKPPGTHKHWLSAVLKCPHCGASLTYTKREKKTDSNFACNKYKKGICKHSNSINQRKAEAAVLQMLLDISKNEFDIPLDRIITTKSYDEIGALKKQIKNVDDSIKRFKAAFAAGIDSLEEYGENKKKALQEKADIEKRITQLERDKAKKTAVPQIVARAKEVYEQIQNENLEMAKRNEIIKSLFYKIVYDKENNTFDAYFNF